MEEKCENCFWNYNCPMYGCSDDDFLYEDIEFIKNCKRNEK